MISLTLYLGGLAITKPLSKNGFVRTGSSIVLTCSYSSMEKVEIRFYWKVGRRRITRRTRGAKIVENKSKRQSVLTIEKASFQDTGLYTCKVVGTKSRSAVKTQRITVSGKYNGTKKNPKRPRPSLERVYVLIYVCFTRIKVHSDQRSSFIYGYFQSCALLTLFVVDSSAFNENILQLLYHWRCL